METKLLFDYLSEFETVDGELKEFITEAIKINVYFASLVIVRIDEIPACCWFILKGSAMEYTYDDNGNKVPIRFLFSGQPVIPNGFMKQKPSATAVEVLEDTTVASVTYSKVMELSRRFPEGHRLMLLAMDDYYEKGNKEHHHLHMLTDAREKVHYFEQKYPALIQKIPLAYVARFLKISRFTYSRLRSELRRNRR